MSSATSSNELDLATQPLAHGLVVQANAGTGKTYSITALIAREVSATATSDLAATTIDDFLIVTFTKEQLSDLRNALLAPPESQPTGFISVHRANLQPTLDAAQLAVEKALGSLDRASISTIHQFCGNILRLAGLQLSDIVDKRVIKKVITGVANDMVANRSESGKQGKKPIIPERLCDFLSAMLSNPDAVPDGLTISDNSTLVQDLVTLVKQAQQEIESRLANSLTHDETIRRALTLLEESDQGDGLLLGEVRKMYRYCIIDESQDTDQGQWKLFKLLFPDGAADGRALIVVGDPKQSIFAFRGADVGAYLEETSQRLPSLKKELTTNFRSDDKLIDALNLLLDGSSFGGVPGSKPINYVKVLSNKPKTEILREGIPTEPVELIVVDTTQQLGLIAATVQQVASLLSGKYAINSPISDKGDMRAAPVQAKDIAVLVKSGPLGRKIQAALLDAHIPAVSNSTESVAAGTTFEAFKHLAAAFERPSDDGRTRQVVLSAFFSVSGRDPRLLQQQDVTAWQQKLEEWREALIEGGIGAMALAMLSNSEIREKFLATQQGERYLTDFNQIIEYIEDSTHGQPLSARRLHEALDEISVADHISNELAARRVESDDDAVQISTIHSTKGLQYPIVLVVDMWTSWTAAQGPKTPRIIRRGGAGLPGTGRVMDVGYIVGETITKNPKGPASSAYAQLKEDGDAEMKRLIYVGVTRAKHHLSVIYPTKETLALRHNLTTKKEPSTVQGCLDLSVPSSLVGLVNFGGHSHVLIATAPKLGKTLHVATIHRAIARVRDRTSFTQIKKQLETPDIETNFAVSQVELVRVDDEFEVADSLSLDDGEAKAPPEMPLWKLPKGKDFGTTIHHVFEHLDVNASNLAAEVERAIDAHVSPAMLKGNRAALIEGLLQVLYTSIGGVCGDLTLQQIPKSARLEEIRFDAMLPEGDWLSVPTTKAMGEYICATVGKADPLFEYAELLSESEKGVALRGTLNGSIDALLCISREPHKFVISDYKSNWLRDPDDVAPLERYSPENLWTVMTNNHYQLQALIYGAATYRYLRSRGMSLEESNRSIAGFAYFFLRGMIGFQTPIQTQSKLDCFVGQRFGVSSWSSEQYPTFWSGLSDVLSGQS